MLESERAKRLKLKANLNHKSLTNPLRTKKEQLEAEVKRLVENLESESEFTEGSESSALGRDPRFFTSEALRFDVILVSLESNVPDFNAPFARPEEILKNLGSSSFCWQDYLRTGSFKASSPFSVAAVEVVEHIWFEFAVGASSCFRDLVCSATSAGVERLAMFASGDGIQSPK
ncbi:hypothetical protein R1sor_019414 [Riccia sorocarpa]|uniref:Uncharacterized protein n=1 Tax=Riccia sorocarpa TaxID=122646 RepID=A0ABD3IF61_9MARC